MISFAKISTRDAYDALTPVQDRLYMIEQTGELLFNGKPYNGDDGTRDWLCFTNTYEGENTVKIVLVNNPSTASLEYSKDGINWTAVEWSNGESQTVTLDQGEKVYFRGDNPNFNFGQWNSSLGADAFHKFVLGEPSVCSGSILSLFSKDCKYEKAIRVNRLFEGCAIVTAPKLSAKVQAYGYKQLFKDCVSLATAPELPATELAQSCYESTFEGCTSLHVAPALPATIMVASCYKSMFKGSGLVQCPELPSVNLADNCYEDLFAQCASLTATMGILPATDAMPYCYKGIFRACSKITSTPYIALTRTASNCCESAFNYCTALSEVKGLVLTKHVAVQPEAFLNCFYNCTYLTVVPEVFAPTYVMAGGFKQMFMRCSALTKAPRIMAKSCGQDAMYQMFFQDSELKYIYCNLGASYYNSNGSTTRWVQEVSSTGTFVCPNTTVDGTTRGTSYIPSDWAFQREDGIQSDWTQTDESEVSYIKGKPSFADVATSGDYNDLSNKPAIPDLHDYLCFTAESANSTVALVKSGSPDEIELEYSTDKQTWVAYTWSDLTGSETITLSNIGDRVYFRGNNNTFSTQSNYYRFSMSGTIAGSGNIMSLLDKTCESTTLPTDWCFAYLFYDCYSITTSPRFPATTITQGCYYNLFAYSSNITSLPDLPATTIPNYAYNEIFKGCTSVAKPPVILAENASGQNSMCGMFDGCSNLEEPPVLHVTTLGGWCFDSCFRGCVKLTKAPELPATVGVGNAYERMFYGCSNLNYVKVNIASGSDPFISTEWLQNTSQTGIVSCPSSFDISSKVPSGWTVVYGSNYPSDDTTTETESTNITTGNYCVCVGGKTGVVSVSNALTLYALPNTGTDVAYAEIVIDLASNATVTAGTNLTLVDTLTAGKRNVCVVRWSGGTAKLFKVIEEDLDESSSSN